MGSTRHQKVIKEDVSDIKEKSLVTPVIFLVISTVITGIMCYPTVFYEMKEFSVNTISVIRNEYSNRHIDKFIMVVSSVLDKYGVAISVVVAQVLLSMARFQQLMVALTITVFSNTLIKMVVRDPRPFFDNESFTPAKCEFEYGFPSGHAQTAVTFYLTLLCLLFREYHIKKSKPLLYFLVFTWC